MATDTRRFAAKDIAVAVAKAVVHHAEHISDRWRAIVADRGIELAEFGSFTIATEAGQVFHLTAVEVPAEALQAMRHWVSQGVFVDIDPSEVATAPPSRILALIVRYYEPGYGHGYGISGFLRDFEKDRV